MNINIPQTDKPRVVVIGGGFGGITLARELKKQPLQVVLIDKHNYHTFQPLLYQVATGGLEPDSIAFPLRKMFDKQRNVFFRMAEVNEIDTDEKRVYTSVGDLAYDHLVIATGSKTNFFGMESVEQQALGMKSIPEALDLRSLILQNFEMALYEDDERRKNALMRFVVVGGGPTGVETAGALAELKKFVLPSDYPELKIERMEIHLVEAADQLLAGMDDKSSSNALKSLQKMGVNVWLNTFVKGYERGTVITNVEQEFETETMIWSAGITGNVIDGIDDAYIQRGNRIQVDEFNRVVGLENVYAVGDIALMQTEAYPNGHPQVAPAAIQQAENLAKNFARQDKDRSLKPFKYYDKGSMATIGRNRAVVDWKGLTFNGLVAWLMWMFVHLLFLIGFRNKLVVFVNWVWSYFTYDKGTRLIIRPFRKKALPINA